MNDLFNDILGELVNLKETKIINRINKKIISTCIFLPEKP